MLTTAQQLTAVLDHWQSGKGPLYQQLADAIVALAESGSLEHGAQTSRGIFPVFFFHMRQPT